MVTRISGLASGMDIDTMVKNLMTAEKVPLDKLNQKKQVLEWQRDDYRTLNSAFFDFRTTTSNMKLTQQFRVRSTDSSNDSMITATATSGAGLSSYTFSSVTQLASAATKVTTNGISDKTTNQKIDPTASLFSQKFSAMSYGSNPFQWKQGLVQSQSISVKDSSNISINLNGNLIIDTAAMNVQVDGVNFNVVTGTATNANDVSVDAQTGKLTFNTPVKSGSNVSVDYVIQSTTEHYSSSRITTYDHNGQPQSRNFLINGNDSLNTAISKVNNSSNGVSMYYDSFSDQVTLTRKETGKFNDTDANGEIQTQGDFINNLLGFASSTESGGQNAKFTINGLQTERNANTFEMNGVTFTLKQTSNNPVTVSVKNDSDKVFDNIKSFVDQYNKLIDQVQGKLNEEKYNDYPPLTDDQKTQLSQTQQDQWTEKAKSGLLKGDSILSSALTQMRTMFYQPVQNLAVSSSYNQLASIGITTTANYLDGGKLQIDEAKLKQAIQNDPDSVENLFRGPGDSVASKGIAQRLFDTASTTITNLNEKAGQSYSTNSQFTIGKSLDDLTNQISTYNTKLSKLEDRYYSQFDAMEQAMQKSNNQMTYLSQLFGGGKSQSQ